MEKLSACADRRPDLVRLKYSGKDQNIALLTLNRPDKANAYDSAMLNCLQDQLATVIDNPAVRAMIITHTGKVFCAGADKSELCKRSYRDAFMLQSRNLFNELAKAPWPTIAAIQGPAIGGGLELALACDMRICTKSSWFALPETELGLIPAAGGIHRLAEVVGSARAKEVVLFGQQVDSMTALVWGLVTKISNDVLMEATGLAEDILSRDALATQLAKITFCALQHPMQNSAVETVSQALLYDRKSQQ